MMSIVMTMSIVKMMMKMLMMVLIVRDPNNYHVI